MFCIQQLQTFYSPSCMPLRYTRAVSSPEYSFIGFFFLSCLCWLYTVSWKMIVRFFFSVSPRIWSCSWRARSSPVKEVSRVCLYRSARGWSVTLRPWLSGGCHGEGGEEGNSEDGRGREEMRGEGERGRININPWNRNYYEWFCFLATSFSFTSLFLHFLPCFASKILMIYSFR